MGPGREWLNVFPGELDRIFAPWALVAKMLDKTCSQCHNVSCHDISFSTITSTPVFPMPITAFIAAIHLIVGTTLCRGRMWRSW